jgi:lactoylglutathione lyase
MTEARATSIGNVAVYVSDLERSERFYVDGLGLEVLARIETPEVREVVVGSSTGGSNLMLAKRSDAEGPVHPDGIWKVFLFTDDAAGLQRRAIAAGAAWVADPQHLEQFRITIAFVKDPDGYLIEIGQRHP